MPNWWQDLRPMHHRCGRLLLVGEHWNGIQLRPVFQVEPGHVVLYCPACGWKLTLNDCQPLAT